MNNDEPKNDFNEIATDIDWKSIAIQLAQCVNFAITNLRCSGSGFVGNMDKAAPEWQHWNDYFADALELIPGINVDREIMAAKRLPTTQRRKAIKKILDGRKGEEL